jgi:transposase
MGICDHVGMDEQEIDLPDDVDALKAMVREGLRREARMQHIINQLQHFRFGARSEKLTPDQYALALEDFEVAKAEVCRFRRSRPLVPRRSRPLIPR